MTDYTVEVLRFAELGPAKRAGAIELLELGKAVDVESASQELPKAELVAVLLHSDLVAGIGAVKRPRPAYARKVQLRAKVAKDLPEHELGYIAIGEAHQGHKLSRRIVEALVNSHPGGLFATTDRAEMKRTLARFGFKETGESWLGNKGQLSLWIRAAS